VLNVARTHDLSALDAAWRLGGDGAMRALLYGEGVPGWVASFGELTGVRGL
jgi:hypothetical protein